MSSVFDTTGQSSVQHWTLNPEGVENLYSYQKGGRIEISLENAVSEIEKGMGMEGFYCPLYSNPLKVSSQLLYYALFLPLSSSPGLRQASADAAQYKSYDRVLLGDWAFRK